MAIAALIPALIPALASTAMPFLSSLFGGGQQAGGQMPGQASAGGFLSQIARSLTNPLAGLALGM